MRTAVNLLLGPRSVSRRGPPLALTGVSVTAGVGHALVSATPTGRASAIRIWYSADSTLNQATDTPVTDYAVTPGVAATGKAIGDSTRASLFPNWDFESGSSGWSTFSSGGTMTYSGGTFSHSGAAGLLRQLPIGVLPSKTYRWSFDASSFSVAGVTPYTGTGANQVFASGGPFTTNGFKFGTIVSNAASADQAGMQIQTNMVGTIDNFALYEETATCLPQSTGYIFVAGVDRVNGTIVGPISGPYTVTIR